MGILLLIPPHIAIVGNVTKHFSAILAQLMTVEGIGPGEKIIQPPEFTLKPVSHMIGIFTDKIKVFGLGDQDFLDPVTIHISTSKRHPSKRWCRQRLGLR